VEMTEGIRGGEGMGDKKKGKEGGEMNGRGRGDGWEG